MLAAGIATADDLPRFIVPGHEQAMKSLEDLHALHAPQAFSACTLWDGMLPHSTLWTGPGPPQRYAAALLARPIDPEGYVAIQQHRGLGHSDGWPFPAWQQAGGTGFHFSTYAEVFAMQMFNLEPLASTDGWEIDGATVAGIDPIRGLMRHDRRSLREDRMGRPRSAGGVAAGRIVALGRRGCVGPRAAGRVSPAHV
jgi:hypothetical protein